MEAMLNATQADSCVAIGAKCLEALTTGDENTAVGARALYLATIAEENVAMGYDAGYAVTSGTGNTILGYKSGNSLTTGDNNIVIGHEAAASSATVDNEITLGDTNITKFRIPGINVTLKDNGGTPTQGHVLTVDGNGEAGFAAASGTTINNNADNRVITGSGTANTLNGEENLTWNGNTLTIGNNIPNIRFEDSDGNDYAIQVNTNLFKIVDTDNSNRLGFQMGSDGNTMLGGNTTMSGKIFLHETIEHIGDSNTKIQFPAADTISFTTSGSERLKIFSNGGTAISNAGSFPTSTSETLHIQGEGHNGHGTTNTRSVFNITAAATSNTNAMGLWVGARTNENTVVIGTRTASGNLAIETYNNGWAERLRITNTGRVGINEASPDYMLHLTGSVPAICFEDTSGTHGQAIIEQNDDNLKIRCDAGNASSGTGSNIRFEIDGSEKMRLHSTGALSVGTSPSQTYWSGATAAFFESTAQNTVTISHSGGGNNYPLTIRNNRVNAGTGGYMLIFFGASAILQGSIISNNGSTSYNSGSDYRLKENIVDISDGITRVKQLQPRRFNWISDSNKTVQDGFIAHELQSVVPEATTGTKDEIVNQEGIDNGLYHAGAKVGDAVYQSVDYGKMTPLLTAALKELITKVETLEQENIALRARVTNLEGN